MEGIILFATMAIIGTGALVYNRFKEKSVKKKVYDLFNDVSKVHKDLITEKGENSAYPSLAGKVDGVNLSCVLEMESSGNKYYFQLNMKTSHNNLKSSFFSITQESFSSNVMGAMGIKDFQIGDERFDREMLIQSTNAEFAYAFLNSEVRSIIMNLKYFGYSIEINEKSLNVVKKYSKNLTAEILIKQMELMIFISKKFNSIIDYKKEMMVNLYSERENEIKKKIFKTLLARYGTDNDIKGMLKKLLSDKSVETQVLAALNLREEGLEHLLSLIDRSTAFDHNLAVEMAKFYRNNDCTFGVPVIIDLYYKSKSYNSRKEILLTLKHFKDESASSLLVEGMEADPFDLTIQFIEALGTCGTKDAIEPIYKKAKASMNPFLRNAAQKAIAQIKSRITDGDTGWLSMYELSEEEGSLSISDEAGEGALSKSDE
jgi:hypothetical protein